MTTKEFDEMYKMGLNPRHSSDCPVCGKCFGMSQKQFLEIKPETAITMFEFEEDTGKWTDCAHPYETRISRATLEKHIRICKMYFPKDFQEE